MSLILNFFLKFAIEGFPTTLAYVTFWLDFHFIQNYLSLFLHRISKVIAKYCCVFFFIYLFIFLLTVESFSRNNVCTTVHLIAVSFASLLLTLSLPGVISV